MNIKKNKCAFILMLIVFNISFVFAEDAVSPCLKKDGEFDLRGLDKLDCKLAQVVVNKPEIKKDYEKKVIEKLVSQLASQAEQTVEEMALLDQYFSKDKRDLLMSDEVKDQCQLQVMANPKCQTGYNKDSYNEKMKLLMGRFPNQKGNSLLELLSDKFSAVREPEAKKSNQCPVSASSGTFMLDSQLSESEAQDFIKSLHDTKSKKFKNGQNYADAVYDKFAQLKLLKSAETMDKIGPGLRKEFEEHVKKYSETNGPATDYIKGFFFSKTNQDRLASVIAHQCGKITTNIENFLCKDVKNFALPEEMAEKSFFTQSDNELDLSVAKGFRCEFKKNIDGEEVEDIEKMLSGDSAAALSSKFTANTRIDQDTFTRSRKIGQFCSLYNCQDPDMKELKSCKNGGPVSSKDLNAEYCERNTQKCTLTMRQNIAYLEMFEESKKQQERAERILAGKATAEDIKEAENAPKRSAFFENFVRNDGNSSTRFVADKKLGLIPEERKYEGATILEKKIEAGAQGLAGKTETPKMERAQAPQQSVQDAPVQPRYDAFMAANNQAQESENARRALVNNLMKNSAKDTSVVAKRLDTTPDSDRTEEMRKLRAELADAINGVKGSEEERLAAATDYNRSIVSPRSVAGDATKGLSQAERDRLDQYRDSLNTWEGRLRNWEGKLTDREMRGFGSSTAPSANAADNYRDERARAAQDGFGASSESSGGLKLTKSAAGASGSVNGVKGEAATERAPGADGSDSEKGIVNSENLATLGKDSLKKLGIVVDETFIIRVRHKDKIYAIPVKTFSYKGKEMYVPILDDKNRDLAKIVFDSPLFSDYRQYQSEREQRK